MDWLIDILAIDFVLDLAGKAHRSLGTWGCAILTFSIVGIVAICLMIAFGGS